MPTSKSVYAKIIRRVLEPKLLELGFKKVELRGCISYEALFRKEDLWLGTSWDWRDRYLDLSLGHLYWFKDVMARVVITGDYSSFCSQIETLDKHGRDYLEQVAKTIANSIEEAIFKYQENRELGESQKSRLRPYLIGRVKDTDLRTNGA
jgi:hypothetical protein